MDGSVSVVDCGAASCAAGGGAVLATCKPHAKYVLRATWCPDGTHVASCSHDQSVALLALRRKAEEDSVVVGTGAAAGGSAEAADAAASLPAAAPLELVVEKKVSGRVCGLLGAGGCRD